MLFCRAADEQFARRIEGFHLDDLGLVHQDAIRNNLRLEAGSAKLLRHVLRGLVILGRRGDVRLGGERLQMLAGEFGVGHGEKLLLDLRLRR